MAFFVSFCYLHASSSLHLLPSAWLLGAMGLREPASSSYALGAQQPAGRGEEPQATCCKCIWGFRNFPLG